MDLWDNTFAIFIPVLLAGLPVALKVIGIALGIGLPIGLLLALLGRTRNGWLQILVILIVETGRGMPILVLLYMFYQGLTRFDIDIPPLMAASIAFIWSAAAYSSEVFKGGIQAVPQGQWDAAAADGFKVVDTYMFIVLPQAARVSIAPIMNLAIQYFQLTALTYVITLPEIMLLANIEGARTFRYMDVYLAAACVYLLICLPATYLVSKLDRKANKRSSAKSAHNERASSGKVLSGPEPGIRPPAQIPDTPTDRTT